MGELKTQDEQLKKISLVGILNSIKQGKNPSQISKELNISIQRLNYHLSSLKSKGVIQKIGYGVWEVNPIEELKIIESSTQATKSKDEQVRGHAFIWKVQAKGLRKLDWKKILVDKGILFEEKGISKVPRIIVSDRKVWLGQKNIIIYEPSSFFARNAIESRKFAVYSLLETLRALESILSIQIRGIRFTPRREHYALVKNALAIQCNKNREKINIFNEKGLWLSIDDSYNLGELETLGSQANQPLDTSLQVQNWYNNHKETNFKVTPDFILSTMNGIQQNQLIFDKNMSSHLEVLKELGEAIKDLRSEVKKINSN